MEIKKFSKMQISSIKRTAQNVNSFVTKMKKLQEVINKAQEEYGALSEQQDMWEAPIISMTGGYKTTDLVDKVVKVAGQDKEGKDIKVTTYVLKYPETVIPVSPEECNNYTCQGNSEETQDCNNPEEVENY